ncbi:hypothetical protein CRD60_04300 [Bifidobacterium aemilianum]|uniref:Colicin transporter n=1 Tax=Bifidobacterium aemilianum TaxID=2493120 RepID=A0A366K7U3_9BIFI|nr:hypothetical protein [Bifidobacterium aemilianum]RBP97820.1 hypothetical protein CRD60_04300 [Bifidobacterium aemilianum]
MKETGTASTADAKQPTNDTGSTGTKKRWYVTLLLFTLLAMALIAGAGLTWQRHRTHERAQADCASALSGHSKALTQLNKSQTKAGQASGITADEVKDPETVSYLAHASKQATLLAASSKTAVSCEASQPTAELLGNRSREDQDARQLRQRTKQLDKAAEAVIASRDAKSMDDARAALQGKRDEAGALLVTSEGNVADGATRETLTAAIQTADGLLADGKTQLQALRDGAGPLQAAMDQVNASIQAKTDTDNQAAAAAAQAQAQQQAVAPSYQGGGGYAGGGYRAPRVSAPNAPAPAPAAPAPSGGNNDWQAWLQSHQRPSQCVKGGACPIG